MVEKCLNFQNFWVFQGVFEKNGPCGHFWSQEDLGPGILMRSDITTNLGVQVALVWAYHHAKICVQVRPEKLFIARGVFKILIPLGFWPFQTTPVDFMCQMRGFYAQKSYFGPTVFYKIF